MRLRVALLLSLLTGGCAEGPRERLVVALEAAPKNIDPRFAASDYDGKLSRLLFPGLTTNDTPSGETELDLAASIDDEGSGSLRIELRTDARFSDGSPVLAADVAATYASMADPASPSPYRALFSTISTELLGPRSLRLTARPAKPSLRYDLEMGILPAAWLRSPGADKAEAAIGAGDWRLARKERDGTIVFAPVVPRPGQPAELWFKPMVDDNARLFALATGRVDLVQNAVPPNLLSVVRGYDSLAVQQSDSFKLTYMAIATQHRTLGDRRVRQAISLAINRQGIIDTRLAGTAKVADGFLPPRNALHDPSLRPLTFDPAQASRLLDDAALPKAADGCRAQLTIKTSTNKLRRSIATLIAADLSRVGLCTEVQSLEWGTFFDDLKRGNFELATLQWPSVQEAGIFRWVFHSASIPTEDNGWSGANRGRFVDPETDRLIEAAEATQTADARRSAYAALQQRLVAELPYAFLWNEDNIVVHNRRWSGFEALPNGRLQALSKVRATP
jgi:peptide/nickel transport system substrate-binding protein